VSHPAFCTMGTGSFLWVKSGRGMSLSPHPLLVTWSRKSTPPMGHTACTEPQCLYKGARRYCNEQNALFKIQ